QILRIVQISQNSVKSSLEVNSTEDQVTGLNPSRNAVAPLSSAPLHPLQVLLVNIRLAYFILASAVFYQFFLCLPGSSNHEYLCQTPTYSTRHQNHVNNTPLSPPSISPPLHQTLLQ